MAAGSNWELEITVEPTILKEALFGSAVANGFIQNFLKSEAGLPSLILHQC
jgi:hypothetical protein